MLELTSMYKLMSDETRLRIMVLLSLDELCVCQLSGILDAPQPRISKNLAKLRDLNLVKDERQEKYVYYKLIQKDPLLKANLELIIKNKAQYPTIQSDIEHLKTKLQYT